MNIKIIYEDENFLAVNKPAGLLVHPVRSPATPAETERFHTSNGMHGINQKQKTKNFPPVEDPPQAEKQKTLEPTLVDWILEKYPQIKNVGDDPVTRPGIVHRLDRDTSGILLIPKTQAYFLYLKNLFQTHEVKKKYLAIVFGAVKGPGLIDKPIGIKRNSIKRSVHSEKMSKPAITEYIPEKIFNIGNSEFTLLHVMPRTGRTHQIRVHLASIGHPILGDRIYAGRKRVKLFTPYIKRQMLHAESLEFSVKSGKRVILSAGMPADMASLLKSGKDAINH